MKKIYLIYSILLFLLFTYSCCHRDVIIHSDKCWESPELALKISNQTGHDITLLSNREESAIHKTIGVDDTFIVLFNATIYCAVDPNQSETEDNPIKRRVLEVAEETPYLFTNGNSYQLRVLFDDEDVLSYIIEPDSGWFREPLEYNRLQVNISDSPSPLFPAN